jgi:3'(2'), 5'-bisphosphate nucleotidase
MNDRLFLLTSIHAALEAGKAILQVYHSDFKVEVKVDKSPLTLADKRSHEIIINRLSKFDIPILSEEGKNVPYAVRKKWDTYGLIDPLDGTKEFVKKNGEFTVNIALIRRRKPLGGVVFVPDKGTLYFALNELGSFKAHSSDLVEALDAEFVASLTGPTFSEENGHLDGMLDKIIGRSKRLPMVSAPDRPFTIIGSRSHPSPELEEFVEVKRREYREVKLISAGSSLKFCLVAEGGADIYPRTGPTMEWDTAAGQAIVENAGGRVLDYNTDDPLMYNKEKLLNPWFVVMG